MHPALLILLSCFLTQLVAWAGKDRLLDLSHGAYVALFRRPLYARRAALRKEIFANKQELNKTSSQDQFAKWAKLRRKVDKGLQELEVVNGQVASTRSSFSLLFKAALFLLTTGVPFLITTYHRKSAIFYLPPSSSSSSYAGGPGAGAGGGAFSASAFGPTTSWLGPIGKLLSLPGAPAGAVSATVWSMACKRVIALLEARFKDLFPPAAQKVEQQQQQQQQQQQSPLNGTGAAGAAGAGGLNEKPSAHGGRFTELGPDGGGGAASSASGAGANATSARRRTGTAGGEKGE